MSEKPASSDSIDADTHNPRSRVLPLVVSAAAVGVFGTIGFLIGCEGVRAWESGRSILEAVPFFAVGASLLCVAFYYLVLAVKVLFAVFDNLFESEIELHRQQPALLNEITKSDEHSLPLFRTFLAFMGIGIVLATIGWAGARNGEDAADVMLVRAFAIVTTLPVFVSIVLRAFGRRVPSSVFGIGGLSAMTFWLAVAGAMAADQLNFSNADPFELLSVAVAILGGGMTVAFLYWLYKIRSAFQMRLADDEIESRGE